MPKSAMKKYRFVLNTLFSDFEVQYKLENSFILTKEAYLVLASPRYTARSALGQSCSAHDVFSKSDMEDAVRLMSSVIAPVARGHILS